MHIVTGANFDEANNAVRDILMMYVDMTGYNGFGHAVDAYIRFDPLKFVDAVDDGLSYYTDMDLLRTGSAMAILAAIYDTWLEGEVPWATEAQRAALEGGRLAAFPDIEAVAMEALRRGYMSWEDPWFGDAVQVIYRKYVLLFFKSLSECDRS